MFKVQHRRNSYDIRTVYAADYGSRSFLIATDWGEFTWVDMDDYWLYEEE